MQLHRFIAASLLALLLAGWSGNEPTTVIWEIAITTQTSGGAFQSVYIRMEDDFGAELIAASAQNPPACSSYHWCGFESSGTDHQGYNVQAIYQQQRWYTITEMNAQGTQISANAIRYRMNGTGSPDVVFHYNTTTDRFSLVGSIPPSIDVYFVEPD